MTLQEAAKMAFGCRIDMSKSLTSQYFWLIIRFLENDSLAPISTRPHPQEILDLVNAKVDEMVRVFPNLVK